MLSFEAKLLMCASCRADSAGHGEDPGDRGDRGKGEGGLWRLGRVSGARGPGGTGVAGVTGLVVVELMLRGDISRASVMLLACIRHPPCRLVKPSPCQGETMADQR